MLAHKNAQLKNLLVTIHRRLLKSNHILLISGNHPDGDAFGSMIGLYYYAKALGKKVTCFSASPVPDTLSFMNLPPLIFKEQDIPDDIDIAISFDHSNIEQTELVSWLNSHQQVLINIDHHRTNTHWGDINAVDTNAAAACELVYNLYRVNNIEISKEAANGLLTGLMTDTTYLGNPATTDTAIAMASALQKCGGQLQTIVHETHQNKSLSSLRLWGEILNQMYHNKKLGVATFFITNDLLVKYQANEDWIDGLANFLTVLSEAKAILLAREIKPQVLKCSFRTTRDEIDVGELAGFFNGGGHQKSAGFTITGELAKKNGCWYIS